MGVLGHCIAKRAVLVGARPHDDRWSLPGAVLHQFQRIKRQAWLEQQVDIDPENRAWGKASHQILHDALGRSGSVLGQHWQQFLTETAANR